MAGHRQHHCLDQLKCQQSAVRAAVMGIKVKACDSAGCGPWSAQGSTTVSIPTAPTSAPTLTAPASSVTGSYAVSWTGVSGAASYNLQQRVNSGSWTTVQASAATGWSASGEASGSYAYQGQACNAVGCGPWSATGTTMVTLPPIPGAPALTVPANNGTGSYTVSWGGMSGASSYHLQQQVNGGSWATVLSSAATSWAASGEASGSYGYRIQSCNVSGCSGWSATATAAVTIPVPIAINGQTYTTSSSPAQAPAALRPPSASRITGGNTWEVFTSNQHVLPIRTSPRAPCHPRATTVQYSCGPKLAWPTGPTWEEWHRHQRSQHTYRAEAATLRAITPSPWARTAAISKGSSIRSPSRSTTRLASTCPVLRARWRPKWRGRNDEYPTLLRDASCGDLAPCSR